MPTSSSPAASSDEPEPGPEPSSDGSDNASTEGSRALATPTPAHSDSSSSSDSDSDIGAHIAPRTSRAYLAHLSAHMSASAAPEPPLEPSLLAPAARWTSAEKDAFFRALSAHSRLRPDLIATAVRTKGIADVCAYIDALDDALSVCRESDSKGKGKGKERAGYGYTPLTRDDLPLAHEVSAGWVKREELLARAIIVEELRMLAHATERRREEEVHAMRRTVRARKRRKVDSGDRGRESRDRDKDRDREGEKARRARFEEWLAQRRAEWEVRDVIDGLDGTMLRAMDALLREDEETRASLQSDGTGTGTGSEKQDGTIDEPKEKHPTEAREDASTSTNVHAHAAPMFDEELIDPVLRGLSLSSDVHSYSDAIAPVHIEHSDVLKASLLTSHPHTHFNPLTPPFPTTPLPPNLEANDTTLSATLSTPVPPTSEHEHDGARSSSAVLEPQLSPASRRRLRKRLYMRRKRAQARGDAVDTRTMRLRPGRKPKPRPVCDDAGGEAMSMVADGEGEGEDSADEEDDREQKRTRHPHMSGKTLPYKVRERLSALGIGVEWLQQEGLDFFHLGAISRLMLTYRTLEDARPGVNTEISADALRLLLAHVVYFTTQLVRKAIVSREQEMVAKMHTKVWRLASNQVVTVANIEHALSLLGVEVTSKKAHFQRLLDRLPQDEDELDDESDDSNADSEDERVSAVPHDVDDGVEKAESEDPLSSIPPHRLLFPPFIRLPSSLQPSHPNPSSQSLLAHIPWARTAPDEDEGEDLLSLDTDEEALDEELRKEEELDALDCGLDASHERGLWEKFGKKSSGKTRLGKRKREEDMEDGEDGEDDMVDDEEMGSDDLDEDVHYAGQPVMRFRAPGGHIKSTVYVEDSD